MLLTRYLTHAQKDLAKLQKLGQISARVRYCGAMPRVLAMIGWQEAILTDSTLMLWLKELLHMRQ